MNRCGHKKTRISLKIQCGTTKENKTLQICWSIDSSIVKIDTPEPENERLIRVNNTRQQNLDSDPVRVSTLPLDIRNEVKWDEWSKQHNLNSHLKYYRSINTTRWTETTHHSINPTHTHTQYSRHGLGGLEGEVHAIPSVHHQLHCAFLLKPVAVHLRKRTRRRR